MNVLVSSWNQLGDATILTGAVHNVRIAYPDLHFGFLRKFKYYAPVYENNPDFEEFKALPDKIYQDIGYGELEDERNARRGNHVEAQTRTICERLGLPMVPFSTSTPVIHLTDEEIAWGRQFNGKWVVNANCQKESISKYYPHWQTVIDGMRDMGLVCCQIGGNEKRDISQDLSGVEDWRGRTTIRQLMSMVYGCEGIVSPSSGVVHIGAAFKRPAVVLVGARENPATLYKFHRFVQTECEYQNCIARTSKDCKKYDNGCPCMDIDPIRVLNEIANVFFE